MPQLVNPDESAIARWVTERTQPAYRGDPAGELYRAFLRDTGTPISNTMFGRTLTLLGHPPVKGAHRRFRGLSLRPTLGGPA